MKRRMRRLHASFLLIVVLVAGCAQGFDMRRADRSVVRLQHVFESGGKELMGLHGSGFVISGDGYVVTNWHVVFVKGRLPKSLKYKGMFVPVGSWDRRLKVQVVWSSKALNLAVLKVDGLQRPAMVLSAAGKEDRVGPGSGVFAIGFTGAGDGVGDKASLVSVLTQGKVNKLATARGVPGGASRLMVQHSAFMQRGSSGGPLLNGCNQVIGINTVEPVAKARVAKGPSGNFVAPDGAIAGTAYSQHVSVLLAQLKSVPALKDIALRTASGRCLPPSSLPIEMFVVVIVLGALALLSMLLALVRRRGTGELSKVVGTYSQLIRRSSGGAVGPDGRARVRATSDAAAENGWVLAGADQEGNPVRLLFGFDELNNAGSGEDGGIIIGRSHALAAKVVDDQSISRRHARVVQMDGGIAIEDLNSTYGTKVNGEPVETYTAVPLAPGDSVSLGDVKLDVAGPGASPPTV